MSTTQLSEAVIAEEQALSEALAPPHVEAAQVMRYLHGSDVGRGFRQRLFRHLALGCEICCGVLEQLREHPGKSDRREELLRAAPIDPLALALDRWLGHSTASSTTLRPAHRYWAEHALAATFGFCRLALEETRRTADDFYQTYADEKAAEIFEQTRKLLDDEALKKLAPRIFADFEIYALAGLRLYRPAMVKRRDARDAVRSHLASRIVDAEVTAAILMMGYEPMLGVKRIETALQELQQSPIPGLHAQLLLHHGRQRGDLATCRAALEEMSRDAAPTLRLSAFHWTASFALRQGEALEAYRLLVEAEPLYQEWGTASDQARRRAGLATCHFLLGDPAAGERESLQAIDALQKAGLWADALSAVAGLMQRLREAGKATESARHERKFARRLRAEIAQGTQVRLGDRLRAHAERGHRLSRIEAAYDEALRVSRGLPRVIRFAVS